MSFALPLRPSSRTSLSRRLASRNADRTGSAATRSSERLASPARTTVKSRAAHASPSATRSASGASAAAPPARRAARGRAARRTPAEARDTGRAPVRSPGRPSRRGSSLPLQEGDVGDVLWRTAQPLESVDGHRDAPRRPHTGHPRGSGHPPPHGTPRRGSALWPRRPTLSAVPWRPPGPTRGRPPSPTVATG